jgi:hypothetical protein
MRLSRKAIAAIVIVFAVVAFFLLPIVPYSTAGPDALAFLGAKANAWISPSYVVFQCGEVYDPYISTAFGGTQALYSVWNGTQWTCGTSWTQTLPPIG